jgi:hypothetical protein
VAFCLGPAARGVLAPPDRNCALSLRAVGKNARLPATLLFVIGTRFLLHPHFYPRRTPAPGVEWSVAESRHSFIALQQGADGIPLHSPAASMDDAKVSQSGVVCRVHVLSDDTGDFLWLKWMKIQHIRDGHLYWLSARLLGSCFI